MVRSSTVSISDFVPIIITVFTGVEVVQYGGALKDLGG